jgi:ribosomal protein L29
MIHPLIDDLRNLSDQELEEKAQDLQKKYFAAYRLGKPDLLTQLQNVITIYKEERFRRTQLQKQQLDSDLEQLINVDRN